MRQFMLVCSTAWVAECLFNFQDHQHSCWGQYYETDNVDLFNRLARTLFVQFSLPPAFMLGPVL